MVELPPAPGDARRRDAGRPRRRGNQVLAATSAALARETAAVVSPVKSVGQRQGARPRGGRSTPATAARIPGAIGRGGTREKDVTLAIARRLAAAINAEEGMRAVLIRDGDYFITAAAAARARRAQLGADMFVSIHADSVHEPRA